MNNVSLTLPLSIMAGENATKKIIIEETEIHPSMQLRIKDFLYIEAYTNSLPTASYFYSFFSNIWEIKYNIISESLSQS